MTLRRTIVGFGEALMAETAEGAEPAGLALRVAMEAVRLGHAGVAVSRLGQDRFAEAVLARLADSGISTSHLQSDPDHPTGRLTRRAAGKPPETQTAYDWLQWDYDLTDLAQQTDGVAYGLVATRFGQTRSVLQQFLGECGDAVRLVDLTNRHEALPDRAVTRSLLAGADVVLADRATIDELAPGGPGREAEDGVRELMRPHDVGLALLVARCGEEHSLLAYDRAGHAAMPGTFAQALMPTIAVAALHATLEGLDLRATVELTRRVVEHAKSSPGEKVPEEVLQAGHES